MPFTPVITVKYTWICFSPFKGKMGHFNYKITCFFIMISNIYLLFSIIESFYFLTHFSLKWWQNWLLKLDAETKTSESVGPAWKFFLHLVSSNIPKALLHLQLLNQCPMSWHKKSVSELRKMRYQGLMRALNTMPETFFLCLVKTKQNKTYNIM